MVSRKLIKVVVVFRGGGDLLFPRLSLQYPHIQTTNKVEID